MLNDYETRLVDIVSIIKKQKFDVVFFQEMTRKAIAKISTLTGMKYITRYGNAIITSLPIISSEFYHLESYRGAIKITLQYNEHSLVFMVTHLDHLKESNRLRQFHKLSPQLYDVDFLIGDMNAIYKADYSKTQFAKIDDNRRAVNLEPAYTELIDKLLEYGFKINEFIEPICPYGTRIDYIFYKNQKLKDIKIKKKTDLLIDTISDNTSDHKMLIMELKIKNINTSTGD